jgi:putative ABC transport system ATP-binding protein
MTCPVISTVSLSKHYLLGKEKIPVLKDISLSVQKGEYVAIMGHSGAGKSTLLNILGCLDKPSDGDYLINMVSVMSMSEFQLAEIRSKEIGFVFQNFNLLPKLDVVGNVELPLIYANESTKERNIKVEKVLTRLGLWERRHHKPNEISGGQKQRVALARALIKKPSIILADEPTGNLDSHTTEEILSLLDELNNEGNTILLITHEKEVAARAGRLIRLVDGRVVV